MELKDVILSTLAELEEEVIEEQIHTITKHHDSDLKEKEISHLSQQIDEEEPLLTNELIYLHSIRERLLVLFEGFQSPNNANIEAKIDMTLNFLEYTLATIDHRIQSLEKGELA